MFRVWFVRILLGCSGVVVVSGCVFGWLGWLWLCLITGACDCCACGFAVWIWLLCRLFSVVMSCHARCVW